MYIIVGIAVAIVIFTIGLGVILYRSSSEMHGNKVRTFVRASLASYISLIGLFLFILAPDIVLQRRKGVLLQE